MIKRSERKFSKNNDGICQSGFTYIHLGIILKDRWNKMLAKKWFFTIFFVDHKARKK